MSGPNTKSSADKTVQGIIVDLRCDVVFISLFPFIIFLLWPSMPESRSLLTPHSASRLTSGLYPFLRKNLGGIAENFGDGKFFTADYTDGAD